MSGQVDMLIISRSKKEEIEMLKFYRINHEESDYLWEQDVAYPSDDDYMIIGDAAEINAIYKAIRRNGWKGNIYPYFREFPVLVDYKIYGLEITRGGRDTYVIVRNEHVILSHILTGALTPVTRKEVR